MRGAIAPGGVTLPTAPGRGVGEEGTRAAARRVAAVTNDPIRGASADATGALRFYSDQDGKFYRIGRDGTVTLLNDTVFYNVERVTWAPAGSASILEYPDGSNIYYNFDSKRQVTLPKHWQDFSFDTTGTKIAAKSLGLSPDNRWLVTANAEGTDVTLVEPLGENASRVAVDWSPNNQIVALSRTGEPLGADRQQVIPIGLHGENFRALTVEGRDLRSQWSPDGRRLLYSVYNAASNYKPELWIDAALGDTIGTDRRLLSVNTWADKCTFAGERYVYCGVPETLRVGAGLAPSSADFTPDRLFRIDLDSGVRTEVPMSEEHVIDTIFTEDSGQTIYFTDKRTSGVYRVDL